MASLVGGEVWKWGEIMKIQALKNASGFEDFISGGVVSWVISKTAVEVERFESLDNRYCWYFVDLLRFFGGIKIVNGVNLWNFSNEC